LRLSRWQSGWDVRFGRYDVGRLTTERVKAVARAASTRMARNFARLGNHAFRYHGAFA
jgi:hypothetical protein